MPNTLAHFAVNAATTRALTGHHEVKWILLGATIPDLPYILKRAIQFLAPTVDVLDLRLLAIAQASLIFSIMLALTLSRFSARPRKTFWILSVGAVAHLLLDACQTKWGNGPALLAPLDWSYTNFGMFWPEGTVNSILTVMGATYVIYAFSGRFKREMVDLVLPVRRSALLAGASLAIYLLLPFAYLDDIEASGAGRVELIRSADRTGSIIEIDRARYRRDANGATIELFANNFITLTGIDHALADHGKVSIRGTFIAHDVLHADDYHLNYENARELASVIGLAAVLGYWSVVLFILARGRLRGEPY